MSLINQVLKDIEQRQTSSQFEQSELKAQLHPVLGIKDDEWRLPTWLKLFVLGFVIGGLIYFMWHKLLGDANPNVPDASTANRASISPANIDLQMHSQLTRTLSSDWQSLVDKSKASTKTVVKRAEKTTSTPSEDMPKVVLNQAQQLKSSDKTISNTSNTGTAVSEKLASTANPLEANKPPPSSVVMVPVSKQEMLAVKPADPGFTSSITPTSAGEPVQVFKQMKPEQEANQYLQRAMDMHQKGRVAEAIDATKKALSLAPQSEEARQLLAGYLVETKQTQEAMQVLQSGLQLQPKQLGLRKALAKLQFAEGQQEKALETLQQGADQAPRDGDYSAFWALTLQKVNKHRSALPLFEQALRTNSNQVQWLVGYAVSLQAEGRSQEALKQFQEAQNLPSSERLSAFIQQRIQQLQNP